MDEKIKVAIGFVTGRPNVCKLINNMYINIKQTCINNICTASLHSESDTSHSVLLIY